MNSESLIEELKSQLVGHIDYWFIVNHVRKGGSTLFLMQLIRDLLKRHQNIRMAVICTELCDAPSYLMGGRVPVVLLGQCLSRVQQSPSALSVLEKLIRHVLPKVVHICESHVGIRLVSKPIFKSRAFKKALSLYTIKPNGLLSKKEIKNTVRHFDVVTTDSLWLKNFLNTKRVHKIYTPVGVQTNYKNKKLNGRFFWASRICPQKNIALYLAVARLFPKYEFDVYGEISHQLSEFQKLEDSQHVQYKGFFNSWSDIAIHNYDAFIYTSVTDGVPNILLEAVISNIPIIAPMTEGVVEVLGRDYPGLYRNSRELPEVIERFTHKPHLWVQATPKIRKRIQINHDVRAFKKEAGALWRSLELS